MCRCNTLLIKEKRKSGIKILNSNKRIGVIFMVIMGPTVLNYNSVVMVG